MNCRCFKNIHCWYWKMCGGAKEKREEMKLVIKIYHIILNKQQQNWSAALKCENGRQHRKEDEMERWKIRRCCCMKLRLIINSDLIDLVPCWILNEAEDFLPQSVQLRLENWLSIVKWNYISNFEINFLNHDEAMRCDDDGDEEETALIDSCWLIINLPS